MMEVLCERHVHFPPFHDAERRIQAARLRGAGAGCRRDHLVGDLRAVGRNPGAGLGLLSCVDRGSRPDSVAAGRDAEAAPRIGTRCTPGTVDCGRRRCVLRARPGAVEHRRHADAGSRRVAARESHAGFRGTAVVGRPCAAAAPAVLGWSRTLPDRLLAHHPRPSRCGHRRRHPGGRRAGDRRELVLWRVSPDHRVSGPPWTRSRSTPSRLPAALSRWA